MRLKKFSLGCSDDTLSTCKPSKVFLNFTNFCHFHLQMLNKIGIFVISHPVSPTFVEFMIFPSNPENTQLSFH